jgi:hypothetical protein
MQGRVKKGRRIFRSTRSASPKALPLITNSAGSAHFWRFRAQPHAPFSIINLAMIAPPETTLADFHHWLLDGRSTGTPFLVLSFGLRPDPSCAALIARHLNEFDEGASGDWLPIGERIVDAIAADPAQRRLLGIAEACPNCPPTSPCGRRKILAALAGRGHVVIDHPLAPEAVRDQPGGFRVAVGAPPQRPEDYHLIIRPDAFGPKCLAPLIADSFLEWSESAGPTR